MRVSQWAPGLWVDYDTPDSWQDLLGKKKKSGVKHLLQHKEFNANQSIIYASVTNQCSTLTVPDSMSGRLWGAPFSTNLTLIDKQKKNTLVWPEGHQDLMLVFSLTCHDAGTSYQHKQWKDLVQMCPDDTDSQY